MKRFFSFFILIFTSLNAQTSYNVSLYDTSNIYGIHRNANNFSEVWGWTDTVKNREYAFIGSPQGTSVVDITEKPIKEVSLLIGPTTSNSYKYHEFRTYKNYLYIGSEGTDINRNAGVQIVDLSTLPDSATFNKVFIWKDTSTINGSVKLVYDAHTVSIEKHFLYVNGGNDFGGTRIMDLTDPLNPLQVGSYGKGGTPYVHDAFIRNDTLYAAAINAGRLDIVDLTTKKHLTQNSVEVISKTPTVPEGRTHQVWLSEDGNYAFVATEVPGTSSLTYNLHVYNITNRNNPVQIATWTSNPKASIHNVFVKGDYLYIGYYTDGFRVLDISNPYDPIEVAFYKTYFNPNPPLFAGAWGVYPYFPSGKIAVSDMNTGLYIFNVDLKKGGNIIGIVRDAITNNPISNADVTVIETGRKYFSAAGSGIYKYGNAAGLHNVIFSKAGFISDTLSITTKAGITDTMNVSLQPETSSTVQQNSALMPATFAVNQNFPNPFNPATTISFSLTTENVTSLRIYDALGKEVAELFNKNLTPGTYSIRFNAEQLSTGIYYYTVRSGQFTSTKRMALIK